MNAVNLLMASMLAALAIALMIIVLLFIDKTLLDNKPPKWFSKIAGAVVVLLFVDILVVAGSLLWLAGAQL